MKEPVINITKNILRLVAELDEFKGEWKALGNLDPNRLKALKKNCNNQISRIVNSD